MFGVFGEGVFLSFIYGGGSVYFSLLRVEVGGVQVFLQGNIVFC